MSSSDRPERKVPTMRAALFSLAAVALCGCASTQMNNEATPGAVTPIEQYAIDVKTAPLELKLAPHADGVSPAQADALRDFAGRWANSDRGMVTLRTPEHGPDPAAAYRTATAAREVLAANGVPVARVRIEGYEADGDAHAPVVASFVRYVASTARCGAWTDMADDRVNNAYPSFGCALTANVAAQVANPADLVEPRPSTAPDAGRRQVELEKYRQGQVTSTPKDPQADGTLANVGQ